SSLQEPEDLPIEDDEDERNLNYNPPAQKSLGEIQELDKDDESLVKYKNTLLGILPVGTGECVCVCVCCHLFVVCAGDLAALKKKSFTLKEGVQYRTKIHFKVNRDIVPGLKYHQVTSRKGVRVDKESYMVGSYGPRVEEHEYVSPLDEAPKGILSRGCYQIRSRFIDDDKTVHLDWEWNLNISKDWDE
uniref:Rho GDP-dissociation inhibitor 1-like n=1 Tax=Sphaeramia orbicularis TaxID=375764 RepID=A0A672YKQ6_9TELE